jgi:hypothetical protein
MPNLPITYFIVILRSCKILMGHRSLIHKKFWLKFRNVSFFGKRQGRGKVRSGFFGTLRRVPGQLRQTMVQGRQYR